MRIPLSWLAEFVDLTGTTPEGLAETLTFGGLEVEAVRRPTSGTRGVVVAEVRAAAPVPGSDKLILVEAFDGQRSWEIVCGASNFGVGDRVPAALPGATLPGGLQIGAKRLMGVTSNGMLASARELGVGDDHRGIWVLDGDAPLGADLNEWLDLEDAVLDLEVTPDRGYALSLHGVARDIAALTGAALHLPEQEELANLDAPGAVPVTIDDPERCPRFTATLVEGVTVRPSPAVLQRRLAAAGMRPRSSVVDATNAAMLETGHPVHAYDRSQLAGPLLAVRDARHGEAVVTLDGVERRLDPDDLVIADAETVVGLAGVMGGAGTEVADTTTDVVIEVASFQPAAVLRTGRRHLLLTEASTRFEKGVPPETVPLGVSRCLELLTEVAGGRAVAATDAYPGRAERPVIRLRPERARRALGMPLADERQAGLLRAIACQVEPEGPALVVYPPVYRPDLRLEADLYEELARLEGYDKIPETVPASGTVGGRLPEHAARQAVRRVLAGAGWSEVLTFPFLGEDDIEALGLPAVDRRRRPVALVNPLSKEESVLRSSLLPGLARVLRRNVNRQTADVAIFEIGRVFLPPTAEDPGADAGAEGGVLPAEPVALGLLACGAFAQARWDSPARPVDVADVVGAVDAACRAVGRGPVVVTATDERPFHPGRAARLTVAGTDIGVAGELHPRVVAALDLPPRTLGAELRLDRLVGDGIQPPRPSTPSPLPSLRLDVAVLVASEVPAGQVEQAVRAGAGEHLTACTLFDVFEGEQIGPGLKNLAYHLRLDDPVRQLTDADAQAVIDMIAAAVADRVGGTLRR